MGLLSAFAALLLLGIAAGQGPEKPNIVFLLTDDQDVKLNSMHVQPKLKKYMLDEGLFFENAFVTHPVCCPSRSSTLTGKYTHNHHTYENNVEHGCNAQSWRDGNEAKTMGAYMHNAGYNTGFFGKYLNNYALKGSGMNVSHVPEGWDTWFALQGNSRFYDYTVSNNGVAEHHGSNYSEDYFTDVIKRQAVSFIKNATTGGVCTQPFFMYIATPAPHRPATPAPQYADHFSNETAPRTPSYGFKPDDKHWIISKGTPQMDNTTIKTVDELCLDRWRTLLSVDDLLEDVVMALTAGNVINTTYIVYNSDHGYHLGQFNQQGEKRQPYDEDIRVPLIVRGPGVAKGATTEHIGLNIDLSPTFIELAGGKVPADMDGRSLKPVIHNKVETWRNDFLVEYWGEGNPCMGTLDPKAPEQVFLHDCHNNTFVNLRTMSTDDDSSFILVFPDDSAPMNADHANDEEYYDLTKDHWQMRNTVSNLIDTQRAAYYNRLKKYMACSGQEACNLPPIGH